MNYLSKLLDIIQNCEDETNGSCYRVSSEEYNIDFYIGKSTRRLTVRETDAKNTMMIDMFVGPEVGTVSGAGLQHFHRKVHPELVNTIYSEWYQLFYPSSNRITSIQYNTLNNLEHSELCVVELNQEEDVFQKSTMTDINIDLITSLIEEHSHLSSTDNVLVLVAGYELINFEQILGVLNV